MDFINHDLEILEQAFTEKQLKELAVRLEHEDPELMSALGNSRMLILEAGEEELDRMGGHQFSEISIVTDDYNSRYPHQQRINDDD